MAKSLIRYNEYGPGMGFSSMKESFERGPYEGKKKIVDYLRNGKKTYAAAGIARDVFTGEQIPGEWCGMTDGKFTWQSTLPYYVERYNLRLDREFEKMVLEN